MVLGALPDETLRARFRAEAVDDLSVVGVWMDEFDVEYVMRFEVASTG